MKETVGILCYIVTSAHDTESFFNLSAHDTESFFMPSYMDRVQTISAVCTMVEIIKARASFKF